MIDYNNRTIEDSFNEELDLNPYAATKNKKPKLKLVSSSKNSSSNEQIFLNTVSAALEAKAAGKEVNPFLNGFKFNTKKKNGDKIEAEKVFNNEGEELETRHNLVKTADVDQFIKIYPELLGKFFELSNAGKNMLIVVFHVMFANDGKDMIYLNYREDYQLSRNEKTYSIKKDGFYRGINELVGFGIIAKSRLTNMYFINPSYMFNGNRVTFCQTFVIRNQKKEN